jgi:hypothetical protein
MITIAGILGGVLGSRKSDGDDASSSSSFPAGPSAPKPTGTDPKFIRQGSRLSVIAWRKSQGMQIFLYYEGKEGRLRWSTYDDTQGSFTYNASYWRKSRELDMDLTVDYAANESSFSAIIKPRGADEEVSSCLRVFKDAETLPPTLDDLAHNHNSIARDRDFISRLQ